LSKLDFKYVEETGSTNDDLLTLAEQGAAEGTAIAAGHQLQGKGRRGRSWQDESGQNALVSVLFRPDFGFSDFGLIAAVAAVAVMNVLCKDCHVHTKIKWPNDLLVGDYKIAGILTEGRQTADGLAMAVGVGVNLCQTSFPSDLSSIATSVALSGGMTGSPNVLSRLIASEILSVWEKWNSGGRDSIFDQWVSNLWGIGRKVVVESLGEIFECTIDGADPHGALRVLTNDGLIRTLVTTDWISIYRKK